MYFRALSNFDAGTMSGVHDCLELVPGASLADLAKTDPTISDLWNPRQKGDYVHQQFVRMATVLQEQTVNNNK